MKNVFFSVCSAFLLISGFYMNAQDGKQSKNGDILLSDGMEMVYVEGDAGNNGGVLSGGINGFHVGKYEVTQAQWMAVMGNNPSVSSRGNDYPVDNVSWNDVQAFIMKLNEITGKNYRLPSEIEWGYAATGGNLSKGYEYAGSEVVDDVAWFKINSANATKPVGRKKPNDLGIYDMSGNLNELCQDLFNDKGSKRVYRGGSWREVAINCRVAGRRSIAPDSKNSTIGFRLAL